MGILKKGKNKVPNIYINNKKFKLNTLDKKDKYFKKIKKAIYISGILDKIPININIFLGIIFLLGIIMGGIGYIIKPELSIIFMISTYIIEYITIMKMRSNRVISIYNQLEKFIKVCNKEIYIHIVDLFGRIYQDFEGDLRIGLETCYIESERIGDKDKALVHFKERYSIPYLDFCIDTFQKIKSNKDINISTNFIYAQAKIKSNLVSETITSLSNTKLDMCIVLLCSLIICSSIIFLFKISLIDIFSNIFIIIGLIIIGVLFIWGLLTSYNET